jgi:hypothetical protein
VNWEYEAKKGKKENTKKKKGGTGGRTPASPHPTAPPNKIKEQRDKM